MASLQLFGQEFDCSNNAQPVGDADLNRLEAETGMKMPQSLRELYKKVNGGLIAPTRIPEDSSIWVRLDWPQADNAGDPATSYAGNLCIGADPSVDLLRTWQDHAGLLLPGYFPFAVDPGGSLFVIGTWEHNQGQVFFWDRTRRTDPISLDNVANVASSLEAFFLAMRDEPHAGESLKDWVARAYA
jgi:SMI1 / KNR4 family (SUKH-1)